MMSTNWTTRTTTISAHPNSSDIHHSEIALQHPTSTVGSSSCPSNREGLRGTVSGAPDCPFSFSNLGGPSLRVLCEIACPELVEGVGRVVLSALTIINSPSYNLPHDHRLQGRLSKVDP